MKETRNRDDRLSTVWMLVFAFAAIGSTALAGFLAVAIVGTSLVLGGLSYVLLVSLGLTAVAAMKMIACHNQHKEQQQGAASA